MTYVLFATAAFPYYPGEQFIETEIESWVEREDVRLLIIPSTSKGLPRTMPRSVTVKPAGPSSLLSMAFFSICAIAHSLFWREIAYLYKERKLFPRAVYFALKASARTLLEKNSIKQRLAGGPQVDLAYSYWNAESAYALCLLKKEGLVRKVISRVHGFDLYEERRPLGYMPLKRQFIKDFDFIHAISSNANDYINRVYGAPSQRVGVSRLGVSIPASVSRPSADGMLRLVSLAFCVPVKRIHKIVDAIEHVCAMDQTLEVHWVHVGGGPLRAELEHYALSRLGRFKSASYSFAGTLSNKEVLRFLSNHPLDLIINSSSSEGVPVSIMEAMALGIPAVAPDVGGVSELVDNERGALLDESMRAEDVRAAIVRLTGMDAVHYRERARAFIVQHYSSHRNYPIFVDGAIGLVKHEPDIA